MALYGGEATARLGQRATGPLADEEQAGFGAVGAGWRGPCPPLDKPPTDGRRRACRDT